MQRNALVQYLNELLDIDSFKDMGPNGLQLEGRSDIKKILCGVSASIELFKEAKLHHADAVLVHHGIIWNFERPVYRGSYKERLKLLLENDINLLAYHLPLDAHALYGNNACIAGLLEVYEREPFGEYNGTFIGFKGAVKPTNSSDFFEHVKKKINTDALIFDFGPKVISSVGIISGGAQKEIKQAVLQGLDVYITGEVSEHIYHYAKEEGIHFIAAGHHATEVFGVKALGTHLKEKFDLKVEFVDSDNPV